MSQPPDLASFAPDLRALVFGAGGGIGAAFVTELGENPRVAKVYAAARSAEAPWQFDLTDEARIEAVAKAAAAEGSLDIVLVATGGVVYAIATLLTGAFRLGDISTLLRRSK